MKLIPLGKLDEGKFVEYSGDFLFDTIESVIVFRKENSGSSLVMDNEGVGYLMLINEGLLKDFTNIVVNPSRNYESVLEANSLKQALSLCPKDKDVYVLGGEKLFGDALDYNIGIRR